MSNKAQTTHRLISLKGFKSNFYMPHPPLPQYTQSHPPTWHIAINHPKNIEATKKQTTKFRVTTYFAFKGRSFFQVKDNTVFPYTVLTIEFHISTFGYLCIKPTRCTIAFYLPEKHSFLKIEILKHNFSSSSNGANLF